MVIGYQLLSVAAFSVLRVKVALQNLSLSNKGLNLSIFSSGTLNLSGFFYVTVSETLNMYLRDASIAMESWKMVAVLSKMH